MKMTRVDNTSTGKSKVVEAAYGKRAGGSKEARRQLQKIIDEWDASGMPKTSAYWRLQSQLEARP